MTGDKNKIATMRRREYFNQDTASGMPLAVFMILMIPLVLLVLGFIVDWTSLKMAKASVQANLSQSVVHSTQFVYRGRGTIQPNCALGAAITQYSQGRSNFGGIVRNPDQMNSLGSGRNWNSLGLDSTLMATHTPKVSAYTMTKPEIQSIQATSGFGISDDNAYACTLPDSRPITSTMFNRKDWVGKGKIFNENEKKIRIDNQGKIRVVSGNGFIVNSFQVDPAVYDNNGVLIQPSKASMCVTEVAVNRMLGAVIPSWLFEPIITCADASLRLHK